MQLLRTFAHISLIADLIFGTGGKRKRHSAARRVKTALLFLNRPTTPV